MLEPAGAIVTPAFRFQRGVYGGAAVARVSGTRPHSGSTMPAEPRPRRLAAAPDSAGGGVMAAKTTAGSSNSVPPNNASYGNARSANASGAGQAGSRGGSPRDGAEEDRNPGLGDKPDREERTSSGAGGDADVRGRPLNKAAQAEVDQLRRIDRQVRRHEQAHKAAGGRFAGAISYDYSQGPDGRRYAVGGEVGIDVSKEADPAATIAKMRQVKAAASAPADPSAQDRAVAASASRLEMEARNELARENKERGVKPASGQEPSSAANADHDGKSMAKPAEPSRRYGTSSAISFMSLDLHSYRPLDVTA